MKKNFNLLFSNTIEKNYAITCAYIHNCMRVCTPERVFFIYIFIYKYMYI